MIERKSTQINVKTVADLSLENGQQLIWPLIGIANPANNGAILAVTAYDPVTELTPSIAGVPVDALTDDLETLDKSAMYTFGFGASYDPKNGDSYLDVVNNYETGNAYNDTLPGASGATVIYTNAENRNFSSADFFLDLRSLTAGDAVFMSVQSYSTMSKSVTLFQSQLLFENDVYRFRVAPGIANSETSIATRLPRNFRVKINYFTAGNTLPLKLDIVWGK